MSHHRRGVDDNGTLGKRTSIVDSRDGVERVCLAQKNMGILQVSGTKREVKKCAGNLSCSQVLTGVVVSVKIQAQVASSVVKVTAYLI